MTARLIVLIVTILVWAPAGMLFLLGGKALALLLPVMGFCPLPDRSGDPGYCESCAFIWGLVLLAIFAAIGSTAVWRKSTPLAVGYAALLVASVLLVIVRGNASINGKRCVERLLTARLGPDRMLRTHRIAPFP